MCFAQLNGCRVTQHPTLRVKRGKVSYQLGSARWSWGKGLHTTKSSAQMFLGVVLNVLPGLIIIVADLMAC
jgi:hypothetical protein